MKIKFLTTTKTMKYIKMQEKNLTFLSLLNFQIIVTFVV